MSRIGRMPVTIPAGVTATVKDGVITVKGPKAELSLKYHPNMEVKVEGTEILVTRPNDEKENRSLHGLTRSLINNMVVGVTEGYKKELEVNGVGYRVEMKGKELVMNLGYSHPVVIKEPAGITLEAPSPNKIVVSGADKQQVGQLAAEIREKRPPEPYKGKGIRYVGEYVRRKEGKTAAKKA